MDSPGASGRRRGAAKVNAEDQALDQIAKEVIYWDTPKYGWRILLLSQVRGIFIGPDNKHSWNLI